METGNRILNFACTGRRYLNRGEKIRAGMWGAFSFGAIALLSEIPFILAGHRVALPVLCLPLTAASGVMLGCYLTSRYSHRKAVGHMDRFFGLKEGLVTADEHIQRRCDEGIHKLQLRHTERRLASLDPARLRPPFPRRLFMSSVLLLACATALLWVEDSAAVRAQKAEEELVLSVSEEIAEDLRDLLEEMEQQPDPEIREMLEDPALREMLSDFRGGRDRKAVMRSLSEIDRRLAQMNDGLDTRADENYLMELAKQLQQSRATASIAQALSKRDYRRAAQELEAIQLGGDASAEQRTVLEKLAAQIGETEKSMLGNESGSRRNAQELSRRIRQMSKECRRNGQCSGQTRREVNQSMRQSGDSMRQVAARRDARSALDRLGRQLRLSQNRMNGRGEQPGKMGDEGENNAGGQMAGEGVDRSRRPPGASSPADGNMEHLSGQLGEGDTERVVEDAAFGTGTSSGTAMERDAVDYSHQLEQFVRREDIPESMKSGVKNYFEQIHEVSGE